MKLWKTSGILKREDISYYDTAGEFEAERFAVNLNRMIMEEMEEKGKEGVMFLCIGTMIPIEAWNHSFRIISNNIWDNFQHKFLIRSMKTLSGVLSTN